MTFRYGGLVGFFSGETSTEASTDDVGPGASLGFGERVETLQCVRADSEALHLSGDHGPTVAHPTVLRYVSQWDTVMA